MPIYTYKCPNPKCGKTIEKLVKCRENDVLCDCQVLGHNSEGDEQLVHPYMLKVLSVPSPMQWGCKRF